MINSYNFKKKFINNSNTYYLEIIFPDSFNNFIYKIYGDKGFIQHGKHNLYNNILKKNSLIIEIDKLQLIFISIIFSDKKNELFDFINLYNLLDIKKKNIKINIERINSGSNNIFNNLNLKISENVEESEEDESEEEESIQQKILEDETEDEEEESIQQKILEDETEEESEDSEDLEDSKN